MDTSGNGIVRVLLYIVVLALFVPLAVRVIRAQPGPRRRPVLAPVLVVVVGVPSLLQFAVPAVGRALERDPEATTAHGQWWRVLTALLAQDGGLVAAVFNLVVVAGVVLAGEWIWGRVLALTFFLVPSIVLNVLAIGWGASGGGSSFASDGLLMSVCGLALVAARDRLSRVCASVAVVVAIVLVLLDDAHGVAMLLGAAFGAGSALIATLSVRRRAADRLS